MQLFLTGDHFMKLWKLALSFVLAMVSTTAHGAEVQVAAVANFTGPMEKIAPAFEQATGQKAIIAYGSLGKFYAQINNGAAFGVLISSDAETPRRLAQDDLAIPASRFTYAVGKLVLWSTKPGPVDHQGEILRHGDFKHIAAANPKLAVYGAVAVEVMNKLLVYSTLAPKFVLGENSAQPYQFVATGNAELGFVALSQSYKAAGSYWVVSPGLCPQIEQNAVLHKRGKKNAAAEA
jgi:molybdate transport system substrate-binding protein